MSNKTFIAISICLLIMTAVILYNYINVMLFEVPTVDKVMAIIAMIALIVFWTIILFGGKNL